MAKKTKMEIPAWSGLVEFLSGKKTFITGALMIALGFVQGDMQLALEGAGLIFLRLGMKK